MNSPEIGVVEEVGKEGLSQRCKGVRGNSMLYARNCATSLIFSTKNMFFFFN